MEKSKLSRLKDGFTYALLFMGFNVIKNILFDYGETSQLFRQLSNGNAQFIVIMIFSLLALWLFLGFLIGSGLIFLDFLKRGKKNGHH